MAYSSHRLIPALLALTISCGGAGQPPNVTTPPSTETTALDRDFTDGQWLEDLEVLVSRLEDVHPNAFWRIGATQFETMVEQTKVAIPELSDDEVTLALSALAATIDGHTHLLPVFQRAFPQQMLPIQVYLFEEGIFVINADSAHDELIGSEVTAFGDITAAQAVELVWPYLQHDNDQTKRWIAPLLLAAPGVLETLGVNEANRMTFSHNGAETTITLPTLGDNAFRPAVVGNFTLGLPQQSEPLYLQHRDLAFWWTYLPEQRIAYMQYNFVQSSSPRPDGGSWGLSDLVTDIDSVVTANPDASVVIDLRHNPGGNNFTYPALLDWVKDQDGKRSVYVITGRNTFSAAMNFATEVEQTTEAIFVGEATGARPNLYGDVNTVILPNSKLVVHISTRYWEKSFPTDDRPWIEPEILVPVTAADYFSGRDAALEAIIAARS